MKTLGIIIFLLAISQAGFAQDTQSEFFYQAYGSRDFVQAQYYYENISHDGTSAAPYNKLKYRVTDVKFSFETGITDRLAFYSNVGYGNDKLDSIGYFKGVDPLNLGMKYRFTAGRGEVFTKTNIGASLWEKVDCNASGGFLGCNRLDNSLNISVRLGYLFTFDETYVGFAAEYGVYTSDGQNKSSGESFDKKGNLILTAFYEKVMGEKVFGGAIEYAQTAIGGHAGHSIYSGIFVADVAQELGAQFLTFKGYGRVPFWDDFELVGGVHYGMVLDQETDFLDGGSAFGFNLGLRLHL